MAEVVDKTKVVMSHLELHNYLSAIFPWNNVLQIPIFTKTAYALNIYSEDVKAWIDAKLLLSAAYTFYEQPQCEETVLAELREFVSHPRMDALRSVVLRLKYESAYLLFDLPPHENPISLNHLLPFFGIWLNPYLDWKFQAPTEKQVLAMVDATAVQTKVYAELVTALREVVAVYFDKRENESKLMWLGRNRTRVSAAVTALRSYLGRNNNRAKLVSLLRDVQAYAEAAQLGDAVAMLARGVEVLNTLGARDVGYMVVKWSMGAVQRWLGKREEMSVGVVVRTLFEDYVRAHVNRLKAAIMVVRCKELVEEAKVVYYKYNSALVEHRAPVEVEVVNEVREEREVPLIYSFLLSLVGIAGGVATTVALSFA